MTVCMRTFFAFLLTFLFLSCSGELTGIPGGEGSLDDDVGTIVNTSPKPSSVTLSMSFELLTDADEGHVIPSQHASEASKYCEKNSSNFDIFRCEASGSNFFMGIRSIYVVDCLNENGESSRCYPRKPGLEGIQSILYEGPPHVNLKISRHGVIFPESFEAPEVDTTVRMIAFETTHIKQSFPSVGAEAKKFSEQLRGASYLLCLAPDLTPQEMWEYCDQHDAKQGDFLLKLKDDTRHRFVNLKTLAPELIETTDTRPLDYSLFNNRQYMENLSKPYFELFGATDYVFATAKVFYEDVDDVTIIPANTSSEIVITFDLRGTLVFLDNMRSLFSHSLASSARENLEFPSGQKLELSSSQSPGSYGDELTHDFIYHPFEDLSLLPVLPNAQIEVIEVEGSDS